MALTLSGDGTIVGLAAGGLPDLSVGTGDIADAAITAAKMSGAQSGDAPAYAARAWVNFNGTGTVAIRASGNVMSITDLGVGSYRINYVTAMSDANYSAVSSYGTVGGGYGISYFSNILVSSIDIDLYRNTGTVGAGDSASVYIAIFD